MFADRVSDNIPVIESANMYLKISEKVADRIYGRYIDDSDVQNTVKSDY